MRFSKRLIWYLESQREFTNKVNSGVVENRMWTNSERDMWKEGRLELIEDLLRFIEEFK